MLPLPRGLTLSLRRQLATGTAYAECQGEELWNCHPLGALPGLAARGCLRLGLWKGCSTHMPTPLWLWVCSTLWGSPFPEATDPREFGFSQNPSPFIRSLFSRGWEETELDNFIQTGMFWKVGITVVVVVKLCVCVYVCMCVVGEGS